MSAWRQQMPNSTFISVPILRIKMAMCRLLIFCFLLFNDILYLIFYIGILIRITFLLMWTHVGPATCLTSGPAHSLELCVCV